MKLSKEKIDVIMAEKMMSQRELSEKLDVSSSTVSGYFKNNNPRKKTIGKIADALGVDVEEIISNVSF